MGKKEKKVFKNKKILSQKISINKRWTTWRKIETNNRLNLYNRELNKLIIISLLKSSSKLKNNYKQFLNYKLYTNSILSSISKQKNYCYYIGRSRSVNRNLYMARHTFRKFLRFGMLPGFIKERC